MASTEIIDLHCHILPGLDDGIQVIEEALEACRIAVQDGISGIVATPHYKEGFFDVTPDMVRESIANLQNRMKSEKINLAIYPGSEIHITDNIAEKVMNGSILTINDTGKYILLELSYQQYPVDFENTIFSLKVAGITPVLAHPERVKFFKDDTNRIAEAVRLGALTQVTSSSIMGTFGEEAREICLDLASQGLVHIIASDSHDASYRPPRIMDAFKEMCRIVGDREALKMISDNPVNVIRGRDIDESPSRSSNTKAHDEKFSLRRFFYKKH